LFAFFVYAELQEVLEMPAATSPSPPPIQGAVEVSNGILVTLEVQQVRLSGGLSKALAQELMLI
jgi:hypothetical protein